MKFYPTILAVSALAISVAATPLIPACTGPCPTATVTLNPVGWSCPLYKCKPQPTCDAIVYSPMACCCPVGKSEPTVTTHLPTCSPGCPGGCHIPTSWGYSVKCQKTPAPYPRG